MTLGVIYNLWDCEYLIEKSIQQIYEYVDFVIIGWQKNSNYGEENPKVEETVKDLLNRYEKIRSYKYEPDAKYSGQYNEKTKRNKGLEVALNFGCTHYILMDADEFYQGGRFCQAKYFIMENNIDSSSMGLYSYYKSPILRLEPQEKYDVPFICKLNADTKVGDFEFPAYCDPTRKPYHTGKYHRFDDMVMHHYTFCRRDINQKINNSSAKQNYIAIYGSLNKFVEKFHSEKKPIIGEFSLIETFDIFGLVSNFETNK